MELHVKRVGLIVIGDSKGQTEPIFKKLQDNWNELTVDIHHSGIDYKKLNLFNFKSVEGTWLEGQYFGGETVD